MKRSLDLLISLFGLIILTPFLLTVAFLIKWDSRGPIFFKQERIGRGFRPFYIYKFRTMAQDAPQRGGLITVSKDPRITRVGRVLRNTKIDELPQLINVLKGDMSLVGPRPEVRKYVEVFRKDYEEILRILPGITDLASLKYQDEAELLGNSADPDQEYISRVLPDKIKLARAYLDRTSFLLDLSLILKTLPQLFGSKVRGNN
jgi:lipopolysaccharide/colanic/teichoic acid biosynthesis glycosyltransferase